MMNLSSAIQGFFIDKTLELATTSVSTYRHTLKQFLLSIGDVDVRKITSRDIKQFLVETVDRGLSRRTARKRFLIISSFFTWLYEENLINTDVSKRIKAPKFNKTVVQPLTVIEIKAILTAIPKSNLRLSALINLGLDTGIRLNEAINLDITNVDFSTGKIVIQSGKGDKQRVVFAGKRCLKSIWRYRANIDSDVTPLFITRAGNRITTGQLQRDVRNLSADVGIKFSYHVLRHTYAVSYLRNGGAVQQLMILLGHSSLEVTMGYVRLVEADIETAATHSPLDNL